ncbi:MAG: hypothetical protein U0517_04140 [Candidatus Andersenbacteria bacterium]
MATGQGAMSIYELGRTFSYIRNKPYPHEPLMLTLATVSAEPRPAKARLQSAATPAERTQLAVVLEDLLFHFGLDPKVLVRKPFTANPADFHPGRTALLEIKGEDIGYLAEVHPAVLSALDINRTVAILDLEFAKLITLAKDERTFNEIPKYPAVRRDLSLVASLELPAADLIETITTAGGELLTDVELFDRYQGGKVGAGKKSYAFHLTFRSDKQSLTDSEVEPLLKKISSALSNKSVLVR